MPGLVRGFAAMEMVVVVGIITIISSIILVRFQVFSGGIHLQRASRETALLIRRAQNMALSVRKLPGAPDTLRSFGVRIDRTTTPVTVILFGDISGNGRYDVSSDVVIDARVVDGVTTTALLDASVGIPEILCNASGADHCADTLDVTFLAPEARMDILGDAGSEQSAVLTFRAVGSAYAREVVVRASGQIFVR